MARIFISVGHGGTDPGCIAADGTYEKDIALEIGLYLRNELERHGNIVGMSRTVDEIDKVADEVAECNSFDADYGVSIHCNASSSHEGKGFEVWHTINSKSKGVTLAENINAAVIEAGYKSRGCKTKTNSNNKDYFYWIRMTSAPVVLCEVGFIDNEENYKLLDNSEKRKNMAICIAKGVLATLGQEYVPEITESLEEPSDTEQTETPIVEPIEEQTKRTIGEVLLELLQLLLDLFKPKSKS